MLKKYATEFLDYCKVAGFSPRSRQSLEISLRELATYIVSAKLTPSFFQSFSVA